MSFTTKDVDYGPLKELIGVWKGHQGVDVAPEPDGVETNKFEETLTFEGAGIVSNAEEEDVCAVRYHQTVSRIPDGKIIHDQVGYWMWIPSSGKVIQSLAIPRALTLIAGGSATQTDGQMILKVAAAADHPEWGIAQSPFLKEKALTKSFTHTLSVKGEELKYEELTVVDIYGEKSFEHRDSNVLTKVK